MSGISAHPDFDDHEMVIHCRDPDSGLRAFVAVHDTRLGLGMGGCRMKRYADEAEALGDALRLSRGMTYKYAVSGLSHGGAKAVILDDGDPALRQPRLLAFARFVERLAGQYTTAEDAGIDTADVRKMAGVTRYVRNLPLEDTGDGALCTAWGVFHGVNAGLAHAGVTGVAGKSVAVEGLGKVGMTLCGLLYQAGAKLVVYDVDARKTAEAEARFAAVAAPAGKIHTVDADVYAPCALGGVLNSKTVPEIGAKVIAGAANNQLSDPGQDEALWKREILYCPDYVVNAGGVLSVAPAGSTFDLASALDRVKAIADTTARVLDLSSAKRMPTGVAAERMAQERLRGHNP